jgi:hypothetical protein
VLRRAGKTQDARCTISAYAGFRIRSLCCVPQAWTDIFWWTNCPSRVLPPRVDRSTQMGRRKRLRTAPGHMPVHSRPGEQPTRFCSGLTARWLGRCDCSLSGVYASVCSVVVRVCRVPALSLGDHRGRSHSWAQARCPGGRIEDNRLFARWQSLLAPFEASSRP